MQKSDETIEFPNIQVWCCGLILWCTAGAHGLEPATTGAGFRRFSTLAVDVGVPFLSAEDALRQSAALPESYLWVASLQGCDRNSQCHRENPHILTLSYPSGIGGSHAWAGLGQSKENWQGSSVRVRCFSVGKSPAIMFFFKCVYHFFGDAKFTKQWVFQKIFIGVKHILINDLWFLFGILGSNPFISWLCKVTIIRRCGSQMSCQCMLVGIQYPSSIFQYLPVQQLEHHSSRILLCFFH